MMNMNRGFAKAAVVLLVLGMALTGCQKSEGRTSAGNSAGANVRVVNVVTVTSNVPFAFLNDDDEYDGYEIAALREMDQRLPQYEFRISGMDFAAMPVALEAGSASIAICMLVKSEARQARFIFPNQYTTLSPINLAVRKESGISSLDDMAGKIMASTPASYEHSLMIAWNESHPGGEIILRDYSDASPADLLNAINRKEVDATLMYPQSFSMVNAELGYADLTLTPPSLIEDTYYMLAKNETQLRDDLDRIILEMRSDGTLGKFSAQFLGEDVFANYQEMFDAQGIVR
jgi:ABC-type amino acid transport substrate-binding protein